MRKIVVAVAVLVVLGPVLTCSVIAGVSPRQFSGQPGNMGPRVAVLQPSSDSSLERAVNEQEGRT